MAVTEALEITPEDSSTASVLRPGTSPSQTTRGLSALRIHAHLIGTVAASFGVFGIFAVQGIILARLLGPERRGEYGTAVFYTQSLTYIGLLGTLLSIAHQAARNREGLPNLRRAAIRLGGLTGMVTALVVAVLALTLLPADKKYLAPLCLLCALGLPWDHIRLTLLAVDHGSGAFPKYNINLLVNAVALPVMLGILWTISSHSLTAVAIATAMVPIVALVYRFVSDGPRSIGPVAEPPVRSLISDGIPYALAQTSSNLFNRLDGFLMLWLASVTVQGYYAAAISTGHVLVAAPEALALFAFRSSAKTGQQASRRNLVRAGLAVAVFQVVTLFVFLALLEPLVVLVFGEPFRAAIPFARTLLPGSAICGISYVAGGYLRGRGKAIVEVWSRAIGAVAMVAVALGMRATWHELSVPLGAVCGQATCALIICWVAFDDVRRQRVDTHMFPEAMAT